MTELPILIWDLATILMIATVVTLIFKKIKQPAVLGYLIAGFLVSPHVPWVATVRDVHNIRIWADLGVIFLLFGLGLEFSFRKLFHVGRPAVITAFIEISLMLSLGYLTGQALGWNSIDSLFLGGILSISSTTIILRSLEELNLKKRRSSQLVFGVLVVEDLVAVLLLVLLSGVAVTQELSGTELMNSGLKLVFFLTLWFIVGIFLLPMIIRRIKPLLNEETTLIVALGLCFFMVLLATETGFSPPLGAFVMGSLLAETSEGKKVMHLLNPIKDLFAAIFFVSVGMLLDPTVFKESGSIIFILLLVTLIGKFVGPTLGALLAGQSLRHALQTGLTLAQIGEFSFIIATLGISLKVMNPSIYPIAVAVSAITAFTTPYLMKSADPLYNWLERKFPRETLSRVIRYQNFLQTPAVQSRLFMILEIYFVKIAVNMVVIIGLILGIKHLLPPLLLQLPLSTSSTSLISTFTCFILTLPFFWGLVSGKPRKMKSFTDEELRQFSTLQLTISVIRAILGLFVTVFMVFEFSPLESFPGVFVLSFVGVLVLFTKTTRPIYHWFENKFTSHLQEDHSEEKMAGGKKIPTLAPWDAHLSEYEISADSPFVGQSLMSSGLKEKYGVMIALIERGSKKILAPSRHDLLLPYDRVFVIGTDEQLEKIKDLLETPQSQGTDESADYHLKSYVLPERSNFVHKSIRDCGLRELVHGLIVGLERNNERFLNPPSEMELKPNDLLWIVGNERLLRKALE